MRVSIVTISFNQERFLSDCLDSIRAQRDIDLDYIVVDPGSTDGSRDLINAVGPLVTHRVFEKDDGPADGLNRGFALATGTVFGFLNADDVLLPGALAHASQFLEQHPEVDVVSGHGFMLNERGQIVRRAYSDAMDLSAYALGARVLFQQGTFFRASAFNAIGGFNVSNRLCWDGELFGDMAAAGLRFALTNRFLGGFRIHSTNLTGTARFRCEYVRYRQKLAERYLGRPSRQRDDFRALVLRAIKHMREPRSFAARLLHAVDRLHGRDWRSLQATELVGGVGAPWR